MAPKRKSSPTRSTLPSFPWRWDVFLSFRGEDTRFNFTDHLYNQLVALGIHTFRDDEGLERGGEIEPSLLKAIEESRMSIVIFSKYYAHSKWCLDELVKIMQCGKEKGQIVLPVFYHVDPSDVRKQSGTFGKAFATYGEVTEERVLRWKTALTEAGHLAGYHVQHGYESEIIQGIARNILEFLSTGPRPLYVDDHLVGMDSRSKEMKSLLQLESNDVRMVGIHGIGGMGKTLLAKVVFNQIAHQFEYTCFLENVGERSLANGERSLVILVQDLLKSIVGRNFASISNIDEGINMIKRSLCFRKVLIILDDVCNLNELKFLAGDHQWFGSGSRIIVTTRDKRLLDLHGVDGLYEVQKLKFEDAFKLFSWNAFKAYLPEEGFWDLSGQAVNHCDGLPLALKVIGSFLYKMEKSEWTYALEKLQTDLNMDIDHALRRTLDRLDRTEKDLFLDIACFFKGEDTDSVGRILDSCNSMRRLRDNCLISILDNKIEMHDLIQKMGWGIIREACPNEPGKRSRLWKSKDVHSVLTRNAGTEAIEGISFDMSASKEIRFTTEAFKNMKRLRLLRVYWDGLSSYDSNTVDLPQDFEFPSYELRYLHWDGWSLKSLPSNFNGEKLVELSLKHSSLKHLWKKCKYLESLKVMELSHSRYLVECPDLSGSPSLETLNLDGCTSLHQVHPSIAKLKNLKILNLANCKMLHYFPRITGLEFLQVLNLSGCSSLVKFPDIESNMSCLLELNLEATAIVELPSSVGYLRGLDLLNMKNCKNLKILPGRICDLKSLKTLILSGCSKLRTFPEIGEVMEHLEKLLLDGTSIRKLPCSINHLKGLVLLNLRKCKDLMTLPNSICGLKSLETLIVSGCSELNRLPEDLGMLQCLRRLQADGTAITKPPISLVHLTNLEEISFSGCEESTSNFWFLYLIFRLLRRENSDGIGLQLPSLSGLRFLKDLDLSYCNLREGMIDNKLCHLDCLEVLNLSRNYIVSIPAGISELSNLRVLLVRQCEQLQKIPKLPPRIKLLDACDCTSLKFLPAPSPMIRQQGQLSSILQQCLLSSTLLGPVEFMLWNCSRLPQGCEAIALEKLHQNLFAEIGYSIVIPGNRIPKWRWHENIGASVSADLPPPGLDNDFLGIVLCAVFALEENEIIELPAQIRCQFECTEGPHYRNSISWTHGGDRVVETDHVWMIYQPRAQFVKSKSSSANVFQRIKASFSLSGASHEVKKCAIRLIHAPNTSGNNM